MKRTENKSENKNNCWLEKEGKNDKEGRVRP